MNNPHAPIVFYLMHCSVLKQHAGTERSCATCLKSVYIEEGGYHSMPVIESQCTSTLFQRSLSGSLCSLTHGRLTALWIPSVRTNFFQQLARNSILRPNIRYKCELELKTNLKKPYRNATLGTELSIACICECYGCKGLKKRVPFDEDNEFQSNNRWTCAASACFPKLTSASLSRQDKSGNSQWSTCGSILQDPRHEHIECGVFRCTTSVQSSSSSSSSS